MSHTTPRTFKFPREKKINPRGKQTHLYLCVKCSALLTCSTWKRQWEMWVSLCLCSVFFRKLSTEITNTSPAALQKEWVESFSLLCLYDINFVHSSITLRQAPVRVPAEAHSEEAIVASGTNSSTSITSNSSSNDGTAGGGWSNSDLADQLLSSVLPTQQQHQPPRQHRSKRFKTNNKNGEDPSIEESSQSSYHKMVNTYQAMTGKEKGDEGGKWLVR